MKIFFMIQRYFFTITLVHVFIMTGCLYAYTSYEENNKNMAIIGTSLDRVRNMTNDDTATTLAVIHQLHDEVAKVSHWFDSEMLSTVAKMLVEMYRKIAEQILIYHVEQSELSQEEFYACIVEIVSHDIAKIIEYLCKEFVDSIFNENLLWHERICHCAWILSIILIIKTSVEEMPYVFNFNLTKRNIENKISEITLCLKAKIDVSE